MIPHDYIHFPLSTCEERCRYLEQIVWWMLDGKLEQGYLRELMVIHYPRETV